MIDYEKFILTPEENELFRKFIQSDIVIIDNYHDYKLLKIKQLIEDLPEDDTGWVHFPAVATISRTGKELREFRKGSATARKREMVKYIVTTTIACLGFLLGIINLLINLKEIPTP